MEEEKEALTITEILEYASETDNKTLAIKHRPEFWIIS